MCYVSKAFDKVRHYGLFHKMLSKGISRIFVNILIYWYSHLWSAVLWNSVLGECFEVLSETSLKDVFRAIVLSRLLYCAPAWSGICTAADRERLEAFLRRCKRYGYCDQNTPRISELFNDADDVLFQSVLHRPNHVLQYLLQDREPTQYSLHSRLHTHSENI